MAAVQREALLSELEVAFRESFPERAVRLLREWGAGRSRTTCGPN